MIQLRRTGTVDTRTEAEISALREGFERDGWVRLPELLDPTLRRLVREGIERGEFYDKTHEGLEANLEQCLRPSTTLGLLTFLVNDQALFRVVDSITKCGPIGSFVGRVYRMSPSCGHLDAWHTDVDGNRLIALSLNLSDGLYEGGLLHFRERSKTVLRTAPNAVDGDAILFRIAADLEHRVSEVVGRRSKTAFAGWFCAQPEIRDLFISKPRPPSTP